MWTFGPGKFWRLPGLTSSGNAFSLSEPQQFLKIQGRILGDLVRNLGTHACGGYDSKAQHPSDGIQLGFAGS
jgi:hypothetical protein